MTRLFTTRSTTTISSLEITWLKKVDAPGQARKFSQSAPRYSGRSSKNGPRDRFDRSQQHRKKLYESTHLQEESVSRPCEVSEERPVKISSSLSVLEVMVSADKKLTLRNTEDNFSAGKVSSFVERWAEITTDGGCILNNIQRVSINFIWFFLQTDFVDLRRRKSS